MTLQQAVIRSKYKYPPSNNGPDLFLLISKIQKDQSSQLDNMAEYAQYRL